MPKKQSIFVIFCLSFSIIAGCRPVGPDFSPPLTQTQDDWVEQSPLLYPEEIVTPTWWESYRDTTLNALIDYAMHQNYSLEAAIGRIMAARANLGFALGEQFPQTWQLEGSALRTHLSENAPNTANINRTYWDMTLGFRVAWEIDFWGRFYRGVEAAYGEYQGTIDDYQDIQRLVISDIVIAYVELKTVLKKIATLNRNILIQHRSVEITEARWESGYESQLDYAQAGALWKQTESLKNALEIRQKQLTTTLAILLGLTPESFLCKFNVDTEIIHVPKTATIGFPVQILCNRPDLRRSLDFLFSQNARVGIAISDLYPRISFTGFLGFESTGKNLLSKSSLTFFYGPSFVWPFFSFGRIESRISEQYALLYEEIALYRNQVLQAYKEAEDALTFFIKSIKETANLEESFAYAKRSVDISTLQYQEGIADYSRVLNSLQLQVTIEEQLDQAYGDIGIAYANIFRALGVF